MYNPLVSPVQNQQLLQAMTQLDALVANTAKQLVAAYTQAMTTIMANPNGLTADQINAGLDSRGSLAMGSADLAAFGSIMKGVINFVSPGTITDANPEATITLP